jgi:folate-binding protein YgfZ
MNLESIVAGTRSGAGLFVMDDRALLEVRGEDRVRWLDGMISGDVQALEDAESGAGCYATLLTNRGAIVADLHVGRLGEIFVLESRRDQIRKIQETLERFIIADDVTLIDQSRDFEALGLEGPRAAEILESAIGAEPDLSAESWAEFRVEGLPIRVGAFGFSGEEAFQIHVASGDRRAVEQALAAAGNERGLIRGDAAALDVMRIEAGIPLLGAELDETVLPPEARLERAISTSKGCYVGQEIVARLRARGQVNHLLVGLQIEGETPPDVDTPLLSDGRGTGEVTSSGLSPTFGPIALAFVRREHSEVGTRVEFEGGAARVAALPFVSIDRIDSSSSPADAGNLDPVDPN